MRMGCLAKLDSRTQGTLLSVRDARQIPSYRYEAGDSR